MSFSLNPVFSFRLNQAIVGQLKFGKYDGIHVCLTAATSTDKVIIHSPHKKIGNANNRLSWSETNYDVAMLNFNQEITAIETGCFGDSDGKEILVIGSPTHVLAYNVDENTDIFYQNVNEGISIILIGLFSKHAEPLVLLGGNDSIRGFDRSGKEKFWIVANGKVNSLILADINKDGKNELIAGTEHSSILVYRDEMLLYELTESATVQHVCQIEKLNLLAYALNDGSLGVYDETIRLWRIKSKNKATSLASFDLLGSGRHQLIVAWGNGKVDMRDYNTGDILFKLNFSQTITSIGRADYRGHGAVDLVMCTANGEIKGYEKSKINLFAIKAVDQEQLMSLLTLRKNLLAQLHNYESNIRFNKDQRLADESADKSMATTLENMGVIPANTRLQIGIYTNLLEHNNPHIEIKICTNNNTIIRAVLIFSEGIFASETYIAYPADKGASRISIPLLMPKDIPYDINIKALVGTDHSQQFHVFELTRQLPRFSMYAMREDAYDGSKKDSQVPADNYTKFKVNERFQRICLWINQNFLLPDDIETDDNIEDFKLHLTSLRDKSNVTLQYIGGSEITIFTINIELAGMLIQSLANFLNIENLQTMAHFPCVEEKIATLFRKIDGFQASYMNLSLDMAQKKNIKKNLIIRIEDARLYNVEALPGLYNDMLKLTEDLVSIHTIRQQNFNEIQKSLEGINSILKSASKLRVGVFATKMMSFLKDAVKLKNIEAINKIITTGTN